MDSWGWALIGLLFFLVLVTVVGHGLWMAAAFVIRGGRPKASAVVHAPPLPPRRALALPPPDAGAELDAFVARLRQFREAGLISSAAHGEVLHAIGTERARLQPAPPHTVPPPLPARAAPAVSVIPVDLALDELQFDERGAPMAFVEPAPASPEVTAAAVERPATRPPAAVLAPPPLPAFVAPAPPPREPRRPWTEVLASFMERRNIRWGELVGGLLIVGCSVALVLSFWAEITQRPVLKFSIFTAVTGALFALGLYTEHRWKLPTTSRGVLLIATLLVPLNFLAFAAFSRPGPTLDVIPIVGEIVAFGLFLWLAWAAAKVIAPQWPGLLTAGVLALSAASLVVRYAGPADASVELSTARLLALAAPAAACYLAASALMLRRARRWPALDEAQANAVLLLLGVLTFALVFPLALAAYAAGDTRAALHRLAPLLAACGAPALAAGLLLWRRVADPALAKLRVGGTFVAVAGAGVMIGAVGLAWPAPAAMLPVAAVDAAVLIYLAVAFGIPAAHLLAAACALVAWLLEFQLVAGHLRWAGDADELFVTLARPGGGTALAGLVALWLAASEWFRRRARPLDAGAAVLAAMATAAVSIGLAASGGFARAGDPVGLAWLCAGYALAAFAIGGRWRSAVAGWAGWALLLGATVQALAAHATAADPWTLGLLAFATIAVVGAVAGTQLDHLWRRVFADPARWAAALASVAAALLIALQLSRSTIDAAALRLAWAAALWLVLAVAQTSPAWLAAGQVSLAAAVALAVVGRLARRAWFAQSAHPLLDPWTGQAVGVALGVLAVAWTAARQAALGRRAAIVIDGAADPAAGWVQSARLLARHTWTVNRAILLALGVALLGLALYAVAPALAAELGPVGATADAVAPSVGHAHAAGWGSWLLLGVLLVAAGGLARDGYGSVAVQGTLIAAWVACPLLAARAGGSGASSLRWALAGYLVAAAGAIAFLRGARLRGPSLETASRTPARLGRDALQVLLVVGVLPLVLLSAYPVLRAVVGMPTEGPAAGSVFARLGPVPSYALPLLALAGLLIVQARAAHSSATAFAAMLVVELAATCGYVLTTVAPARPFDGVGLVHLAQLDAAVASAFALAWYGVVAAARRGRAGGSGAAPQPPPLPLSRWLLASVVAALAVVVLLAAPGMLSLFVAPAGSGDVARAIGGPFGWAALLLTGAAAAVVLAPSRARLSLGAVAAVLVVVAAMTAFAALEWDRAGNWLGYHVWMAGQTAAAGAMLALGWWLHRRGAGVVLPASLQAADDRRTGNFSGQFAAALSSDAPPAPATAATTSPPTLEYQNPERLGGGADAPAAESTVYVGGEDVRDGAARWAGALGAVAVLLALRAALGDAAGPWPAVGVVALVGLLTAGVAVWLLSPGYLYGATALMNLAATVWYAARYGQWQPGRLVGLLEVNAAALALPAVAWLVLDLEVFRRRPGPTRRRGYPPVHHVAAVLSVAATIAAAALCVAADLAGAPIATIGWFATAAVTSAAALCVACLWDARARFAAPCLYAVGLAALGLALDRAGLPPRSVAWAGMIVLAGYALLTSALWAGRGWLASIRQQFGGPPATLGGEAKPWPVPANLPLAGVVIALAFWTDLAFPAAWQRAAGAAAALSQCATLALAARGRRGSGVRQAAIAAGVAGAVALGWAAIDPAAAAPWLGRAAVALIVLLPLAQAALLAAGALARRATPWARAARELTPAAVAVAVLAVGATLGVELSHQLSFGVVPLNGLAIALALLALVGACAVAVRMALAAEPDPLGLSGRARTAYVYAAEALLVAAFVHVRLTMPHLFGGYLRQFWPLVVMAIAFAGVGAGEALRRRGRTVLAEPLGNTGLFLPLVPALGFWVAGSRVDYTLVLGLIGLLYGGLAIVRQSFAFGVLAAVAANGGLWYFLHRTESFGFAAHPQLWVIPAALSVLAAAELNRAAVSAQQLRGFRYAALVAVYLSSTADVVVNGVAHSPWLPLVLAGLSVAGVLVGISFRIRPFLFLGTGFLLLAVVAMIANAAANLHWTWLWYVAGILLGLGIIALFAVFEKKRPEMLAMIEGLRAWE